MLPRIWDKARRGDPVAKAKLAGEGMFAAVAGIAAAPAFSKLSQTLGAIATPLGTIAAVQATMSKDEGTRGLGFAAEALLGSASALNSAAVNLGGKSGLGDLPGGGGEGKGEGKGKGTATEAGTKAGKKPSFMGSVVRKLVKGGEWVLKNGAWVFNPSTAVVGGIIGAAVGSNAALDAAGVADQPGATVEERKARAARRQAEYDADKPPPQEEKTSLSEEAAKIKDKIEYRRNQRGDRH